MLKLKRSEVYSTGLSFPRPSSNPGKICFSFTYDHFVSISLQLPSYQPQHFIYSRYKWWCLAVQLHGGVFQLPNALSCKE